MTEPLDSFVARAIGLTLLEFVWQGAAIGVVVAIVLRAMSRASAQARYLTACAGLLALTVAPILTLTQQLRDDPGPAVVVVPNADADAASPIDPIAATGAESADVPVVFDWRAWIEARLPFVVVAWATGVMVLSLQFVHGWLSLWRLRRRVEWLADSDWPGNLRALADALRVPRRLRLATSSLIDVPAVVGWLRPIVVVPVSAIAALPPAHLEAILAHELAHVRRADYLVNLWQCVMEILLFYHPAVWWVSKQMRIEREHCCDDAAAALSRTPLAYAGALASLEELRATRSRLAVAAGGGDLARRIRRLVDPSSARRPSPSGGIVMGILLALLIVALNGPATGAIVDVVTPPQTPDAVGVANIVVPPARETSAPAAPVASPANAVPASPKEIVTPEPPSPQVVQSQRGSIAGRVIDADGGAIPGTTVKVSIAGRTVATLTTNSTGEFVAGDLEPGVYDLEAQQMGFRTARVRLTVSTAVVTPTIRLQLGGITETVEIRASGTPPRAAGTPPPASSQTAMTAADFAAAAKSYYEQGRLADAERMAIQALELIRADLQQATLVPPPTTPVTGGIRAVKAGGEVDFPRKIGGVEPAYPEAAKAAGVQGAVYIDAVLAKDGTVKELKILRGDPMLSDAALDAVRQWRYTPTKLNGVPVEVQMTVIVNFRLR